MKKYLLLFSFCVIILIFCACGLSNVTIPPIPTSTPVPKITVVPTVTPEPTIVPAGLENRIVIRIIDEQKTAYDPEYGTIPIFFFRCQIPVVLIDNNKESEDTINAAIEEMTLDYFSPEGGQVGLELDKYNEMLSLAEGSYSSENEEIQDFKFSRIVEILRADDNIICLKFINTSIQFGTETTSEEIHYFDTSSGTEIDESLVTKDAFPSADKTESGELVLLEEAGNDRNIIDLVEIDKDGDTFLLECDGIIYDLYIGNDWYCNVMNNDSVQLKVKLPDGMPNLLISYSSRGDLYNYLLAKNLETGKAELVDYDSISAVG